MSRPLSARRQPSEEQQLLARAGGRIAYDNVKRKSPGSNEYLPTVVVARLVDERSGRTVHTVEAPTQKMARDRMLADIRAGAVTSAPLTTAELAASREREAALQAEIERLRAKTDEIKGENTDRKSEIAAALTAAGVEFDPRLGLKKLEALAAENNVTV